MGIKLAIWKPRGYIHTTYILLYIFLFIDILDLERWFGTQAIRVGNLLKISGNSEN